MRAPAAAARRAGGGCLAPSIGVGRLPDTTCGGLKPRTRRYTAAKMARTDPWPRTILHVDLDAFHTSVHQREDQSLRGQPVVVASRSRRATVVGASYQARAIGIQAGMPLQEALERSPDVRVVPPQRQLYREVSRQSQAIYRRFTSPERIEATSLESTFLDVTARTRHGTSSPEDVARRIKFMIQSELGLTASVGAATSKLVARIAGGSRQPDGLILVPPGTEADFLTPLPVSVMPNLGPKTSEKLAQMGIRTVGDLATYDLERLLQALGSPGAILQRFAQGRDRSPVEGNRQAKTISAETTFERAEQERERLDDTLRDLVGKVCERLRAENVRARTAYVKLRLADLRLVTRQVSRPSPTDDADVLFRSVRAALDRARVDSQPVRLIGVGLSGLEHPTPDPQLTLFD
jgi:DNA polymerase IV